MPAPSSYGFGQAPAGANPASLLAAQQAFQRTLEEKELQFEQDAIQRRQQAVGQRLQALSAPPGQAPGAPQSPMAPKAPTNLQAEIDSLKNDLKEARKLIDLLQAELKKYEKKE